VFVGERVAVADEVGLLGDFCNGNEAEQPQSVNIKNKGKVLLIIIFPLSTLSVAFLPANLH